jgi:hypothetical protein
VAKPKVTVLYCDDVKFKNKFLCQWEMYRNGDCSGIMGVALHPCFKATPMMPDIMIFQDGIDFLRAKGINATRFGVLLHELQHVAMFRKGLAAVEPYTCLAEEYGVIEGMRPPVKHITIKPHWGGYPSIPKIAFYSHAKLEEYDITWQYKFKDQR